MASASSGQIPVDWELISQEGPRIANHVGCVVGNTVYVHGGIDKYGSTTPSFKFYKLDLSSSKWSEITAAGSPALSHHACVTLENRYMVLIGGWDGRQRVSSLHAFDTQEQKWLPVADRGFPEGAGLSSHAATVLTTGEILIIGREGSLRIQRKHGNVYVLNGSVQKGEFTYRKMTNATSSRSGHSINTVGNVVYIIGGRDDNFVEFHSGYKSSNPIGSLNSRFPEISEKCKHLTKPPSGRKNHVSFGGKDGFIIHGGDTFDGRIREPVNEMFLVLVKPHLSYFKIGNSAVSRSSHICVSTGDRIIIHGGVAGKSNMVFGDCYDLRVKK